MGWALSDLAGAGRGGGAHMYDGIRLNVEEHSGIKKAFQALFVTSHTVLTLSSGIKWALSDMEGIFPCAEWAQARVDSDSFARPAHA